MYTMQDDWGLPFTKIALVPNARMRAATASSYVGMGLKAALAWLVNDRMALG